MSSTIEIIVQEKKVFIHFLVVEHLDEDATLSTGYKAVSFRESARNPIKNNEPDIRKSMKQRLNKVVRMQEILVELTAKSCTHRKFPDSKQEVNSSNSSPKFRGTKPGSQNPTTTHFSKAT